MKINPTKTVNELLTVIAYVIDIEKNKNIYHAWRVSTLSVHFAKNTVSSRKLKDIFYASLLHDIGGVGFPYHIVHYLKRTNQTNQKLLLSHPIIGAQLVSHIPEMARASKLVLDHHEWINGKGYPRAKTEKDIPWGSQVIRLADSVDIFLQTGRFFRLKELKDKMSINIRKEYSKKLFDRAFNILKQDRFFYRIRQRRNIPIIFKEIKDKVGFIHIPLKIDAIGTTLEVIAQIIDMKHPYTLGHSLRVSHYALACALTMNLEHDEVTRIKWAGLIHDIGKVSVPRQILDKTRTLTKKEFGEVKKHASLTPKIMAMISTLKEISPIASSHHEHFDGSGYPQGLKGEEIPLGARILAVCDAFDALTSNRPYRPPVAFNTACQEIKKHARTQFDPEIVKQTLPLFKNLGL